MQMEVAAEDRYAGKNIVSEALCETQIKGIVLENVIHVWQCFSVPAVICFTLFTRTLTLNDVHAVSWHAILLLSEHYSAFCCPYLQVYVNVSVMCVCVWGLYSSY